ncbi:FAD-binding domain-containing protein [Trametes coccinea BRFM310]|uniref:FAD-binding domain-containing protein n=1 Tax=Trametes coccinea (strain BRFM310) TaxID=1353009 RepID=A0A1Y2IIK8_TRAC3|nr:FAD-binding domain-containing protein [Trametes coccinea BRFM310]
MRQSLATATYLAVLLAAALPSAAEHKPVEARGAYASVCQEIREAISSASAVHFPGLDAAYVKDISHWATSSTAQAACSVEPGTAEDVGTILQILGKNKTPFAVKGAGHASNPGFSSTPGVQIAMYRFSEVNYDAAAGVAEVGAGLIWDDVYTALEPYAVSVVGGRVSGVGVAGFTLGGGYSWKTNQFGLTVDNLSGFELVLPNGTVAAVTQDSYPDLFWGLKGGFNNFGIVTKFNLTTHPQTEVWGGLITITEDQLDKVNAATVKFAQTVNDPKAQVLPTYNFLLGEPGVSLLLFYDYPTPPDGIFDDFLAIPHFTKDVKTRTLLDLVKSAPANATGGQRAIFHTVSLLQFNDKIMDAVLNETKFWGERLSFQSGNFISYDVEPFLSTIFSHAPEGSSAYPPSRSTGLLPLNIYYAWGASLADETMQNAARQSAAHLTQVILGEGQDISDAALYGNYAILGTPLERIYGQNVPKLKALKAKYDPGNVMGLAGGWKFGPQAQ